MGDTPFFSIIVPVYNAERYIKICINSILSQTFKDFEVILVDDASTDNSYKICKEFQDKDKRVKLFRHKKNLGQGPARNTGIKNSRGEYIGFVDNDDAILPNALEKLYKVIQSDTEGKIDTVYVTGHYETKQDDDKPINIQNLTLSLMNEKQCFLESDIKERITEHWIKNRIWLFPWRGIYRRKFLLENKIEFPSSTCEDHVLLLATMLFSKRYFMLRDAFYIWRLRNSSKWHTLNVEESLKSMTTVAKCFEKLINRIPEIADNRSLKEQCTIESFECVLRDRIRPLYNGAQISAELDQAVYEAMRPIFGENTTLVKYLFHGFNQMWRQANILAQQNYLLRQKDELIAQQGKLLEQMNALLEQQNLNE